MIPLKVLKRLSMKVVIYWKYYDLVEDKLGLFSCTRRADLADKVWLSQMTWVRLDPGHTNTDTHFHENPSPNLAICYKLFNFYYTLRLRFLFTVVIYIFSSIPHFVWWGVEQS